MTSLAEDEGTCESTLDELAAALMTRRKYSNDPVLYDDIKRLKSISDRWLDECLYVTPGLRSGNDVNVLLCIADLIFGHRDALWQWSSFYRSRRLLHASCA